MQKALVIYYLTDKKNNIEVLNNLLLEGWKVVSQRPMGVGEGSNAAYSMVIIEK